MNALINTPTGRETPATMSSREIAELCEKEHKHVIRDIRTMLDALGNDGPDLDHVREEKDARGYTKEFLLPKDLTLTLVAGYDIRLRHRIVKRLEEYEARSAHPMAAIDMRDTNQLRLAAIQLIEMNQEKDEQIAKLAPKAEALDRLETSEGSVGPRLAAKMLNMPERKFTKWLEANHWAFRQNGIGPLQAYRDKRERGYLEHRPHTYHDQVRGEDRTVVQMMITPKGLARLAILLGAQWDVAA